LTISGVVFPAPAAAAPAAAALLARLCAPQEGIAG
jgi:hypothetical protein